ncbi:hypothetical protein OG401_41740 [Kitasatospora purpeofusca]|uniref:hypothetical protein n=1 Tax=Kitasatospora purpeofusca TaxID=67352 RepID=UPI0022575989|nr:hypothetical protein [Kitasatospora purpeofusca]MCX4690745.1 hypothetical protein [Kitasatospora purpeofusca]
MTLPLSKAVSAPVPAPDDYVLPNRLTRDHASRGPRFGDDVWDLGDFFPRTEASGRIDFLRFEAGLHRQTAKEFLYSRLRRRTGRTHHPMKPTAAPTQCTRLVSLFQDLRSVGVRRLQDAEAGHLETLVTRWEAQGPHAVVSKVNLLKHLSAHGPFLSGDRLAIVPWPHRSAKQVAKVKTQRENSTPRIPEEIMRPLLSAALFYVQVASRDLLAAQALLEHLREEQSKSDFVPGRTRERLDAFIAERRALGRGMPALPIEFRGVCSADVVDGVVQAPNLRMTALLIRAHHVRHLRREIEAAGRDLGWEAGGLAVPMSEWPGSGLPWRSELSAAALVGELVHLRTACWIVIAYLSGMRDVEVRELGRECAFTEPGSDGRTRYKIKGRVFKGRRLTGDEAEWVVLDVVHQAVGVLKQINDDPTHLFGTWIGEKAGYGLFSDVTLRLKNFQQHLNDLFGAQDDPYIPLPLVDEYAEDETADDAELGQEAADETGDDAGTGPVRPWWFDTRQFRRTLAWHIAHQPFGIVAGTRQYKHNAFAIFEGYAGTSASGFADEVASEKAVALLDYVEDLYHDHNEGGRSAGGAAGRVAADFDRIRAELGDLPGTVASPERLRAALRHLTRTLHPGILNDCFHHAATAVCGKRAKSLGRPLPMLNACLACPNARRSAVHLPRMAQARDLAAEEFAHTDTVPKLQRIAIEEHLSTLTQLIAELRDDEGASA